MPRRVRILLAEDNPADVYLIEEALREHGLDVELILARDGEQAMNLIAEDGARPALVLLDYNMPKRNGSEVLAHLRSTGAGKDVPVIVFTSSDSPADRADAMRLGATLFVRKPTGLDEFMAIGEAIKDLLGPE